MKIGFVSPYDYAVKGGVNEHIVGLSGQFANWGHDVRIIAPCSTGSISDEGFIPMGRAVPVPSGGSIARISLSLWLRPRIKSLLLQEAFDVVHVHEPFSGAVPVNVLSVASSVPSVMVGTFHTFSGTRLYKVGAQRFAMRYFRRLQGRIAVSKPARDFISQHFPGDYEIIPNGINVRNFADATPFPHLIDGKTNILFVGRLEKRKGLRYLLEAYSRLKWDWPDTRLLVVGRGKPDEESYRIIAERNLQDVVFLGNVTDEDKARYYKTADIYCSPATGRESFGVVLLEAMAAGAPVVASNIEGYSSVISHDREGLLVQPKDDAKLADALGSLLARPDHRRRLAAQARASVEQFDWEVVASRVMDYYQSLLKQRTPASA